MKLPKATIFGCLLIASAAMATMTTTTTSAFGADPSSSDKARAKEAYDRGLEAHKRGDSDKAAEEFARADSIAPSSVALQAALDSAIEADDAPLGAELLERSKRGAATPGLASSITAAHLKFNNRAARIRVVCPAKTTCVAKLDDKPMDVDKVIWARTGQRSVIVYVDGEAHTKVVDLNASADQITDVAPGAKVGTPVATRLTPASGIVATQQGGGGSDDSGSGAAGSGSQPPTKEKRGYLERGFPPILFYAGVGVTVVLAGVTSIFALSTASSHDKFSAAGCEKARADECEGLKEDGESSQTATNIALVSTAVVGLGTAAVGLFLTDWKGPVVAVHPGGGSAVWRVAF